MGDTSLRRASGVLARVRKSGSTLPGRRIPAAMLSLWTSSPRWVVLFMAGPPYVARAAGLSRDQSTNPCGRGRPLESVHMMTRLSDGQLGEAFDYRIGLLLERLSLPRRGDPGQHQDRSPAHGVASGEVRLGTVADDGDASGRG